MSEKMALNALDQKISEGLWGDVIDSMTEVLSTRNLSDGEKLRYGLSLLKTNAFENADAVFESIDYSDKSICKWLRMFVISPFIRERHFVEAETFLNYIVLANPDSAIDLGSLGSVLVRAGKREEGLAVLERALNFDSTNDQVASQVIQLNMQLGKANRADEVARSCEHIWVKNKRLLSLSLLAMSRVKNYQGCLKLSDIVNGENGSEDVFALLAQVLFEGEFSTKAYAVCEQAKLLGIANARVFVIQAQIELESDQDLTRVLSLLKESLKLNPELLQANTLMGELCLRTGNAELAKTHLLKALEVSPELAQTRALLSRAYKYLGDYTSAAEEMEAVVKLRPDSDKWKRYASAAMLQAGREEDALVFFEDSLRARSKGLPETFAQGLDGLKVKAQNMKTLQSRLDWLWAFLERNTSNLPIDRVIWEDDVKWAHLADHFLLDWLECRPHQSDEAMSFLSDISQLDGLVKNNIDGGLIFASAHVGCLYAGPLTLELLGIGNKWLASTPSISTMPYTSSLISTSDKTEAQVVRSVLKALKNKQAVTIAVDGAMSPSAPTVDFEGLNVTYSDFAAKMVYRSHAKSIFVVPYWSNGLINFFTFVMPSPLDDESEADFCNRWRLAFFDNLKIFLLEHSENARISGGIWRRI